MTTIEPEQYLSWALSGAAPPQGCPDFQWLLAYCTGGVVWGCLGSDSEPWRLSCQAFPEVSPVPRLSSLLELRMFGATAEILIWRTDTGHSGRVLHDASDSCVGPLKPKLETLVLAGDRLSVGSKHGFSLVSGARGVRHAVPLELSAQDFKRPRRDQDQSERWFPLRLEVCHYLDEDPENGVVRVLASRLVRLTCETWAESQGGAKP